MHNGKKKMMEVGEVKRKVWIWVGCGIVVFSILFIGISQITKPIFSKATVLTEQEAREVAEERYSGKVKKIYQTKDTFVIELDRDTGIYELIINAETGEVSSLKRTQQKDGTVESKITEEKSPEPTVPNEEETVNIVEPPKNLTEQEAATIALEQVPGTVDDIEIMNVNDIAYYFVEVETNDGREAKVEINAITGEVRSFTWDDHGRDDDD